MLHLFKNIQNTVNVTVSNESELNSSNYLWVLTHLETREKVYFIPFNISVPHEGRFDTFTFNTDETQAQVFTGSTCNIHLLGQGQYQYTIYDQVSPNNLNPLLANSIVENGLAWVDQTEICFDNYISDNDETIAVVYYNPDGCVTTPWNEVNVNWEEANWDWEDNVVLN